MSARQPYLGLFRQRLCLLPTWRGGLLLAAAIAGIVLLAARGVHPFLAVNAPTPGGVLVVEGWLPDWALEAVVREFRRQPYRAVYVTGIPIERGAPLSEYKTYAELGAATLVHLGLPTNVLQAVPAPAVQRDRTYAAALALRQWLRNHGDVPEKINIVSVGPHARRSRLLFRRAFGDSPQIGILSLPVVEYDPVRWWASSQGFRIVTGEATAYLYARCLFRP